MEEKLSLTTGFPPLGLSLGIHPPFFGKETLSFSFNAFQFLVTDSPLPTLFGFQKFLDAVETNSSFLF